ncbi:sugar kinase [Paucilactobacillus suebicus]|uniref:2-dehydro-3-deoxygluconokinase n=1 Tax=Paucilactobacillus suebicus DSM 5007 = KCTC 3549 TaxID=1423807 RepID=A0A0R1W4Q5_9LACO|nr:sugar kinase [Paucilactobacillus suebicus]KRM12766.1 2-dehydro-3-deoxygluconokinase [Paucilactobacillus suebicus DSM 5007 = KCTC 3549]
MAEMITIGEPMVLFASDDPDVPLAQADHYSKYSAGAELNVAVGVARLGHRVEYASMVGIDPLGEYLVHEIKQNKIGTDYLDRDPNHWTGFYLKQLVTDADPDIFYFRKDSAASHFDAQILSRINFTNLKIAHLSGIFAALSDNNLAVFKQINNLMLQKNVTVTFDPNLRPSLWRNESEMIETTNDLAKNAHIVMPGLSEGRILTRFASPEDIAGFYLSQSKITNTVIIKLGENGAFIMKRNGYSATVSGYQIDRVVDTVGAGDGFVAGILTALLEDQSIENAVKRGCAVGAMAVMSPGDNDGYPTVEQLTTFLASHSGGRVTNEKS